MQTNQTNLPCCILASKQIRLAQDIWNHVDKISSAHVYLRMPDGIAWSIPAALLTDCALSVKADSVEGNKKQTKG
ncbi:uncharacterized protein LACBIDRAFT_311117 [Laccaria bicolor S238N-H82]|uniref:Predicted protein n=1 Tax=Laccaria bicolor (strain S238N-H82 / ATCC MYA-4686) TaxID=486041 RepID=B0CZA0_LACBS|nr:uncharacterized protein LACBIDRAFT_311117 [Laccaria bicolor S238N-H82]EDR12581.1 predicted protein [Laccaria bicolor S238N-H82]|eukprot:XP_001876845.1 predicted protein [Laccaria bicolor S238N-H82]